MSPPERLRRELEVYRDRGLSFTSAWPAALHKALCDGMIRAQPVEARRALALSMICALYSFSVGRVFFLSVSRWQDGQRTSSSAWSCSWARTPRPWTW